MPRKKPPGSPSTCAQAPRTAEPLPGINPAVPDPDTPDNSPPFPIVAVGASAGGLSAFQALLGNLPGDTGMAFVLVQHLDPVHESLLPEILSRSSNMPVLTVEHRMEVKRDHVYVIPPGKDMVYARGKLELAPRSEFRGQHRPIDHFMRSLAGEHGHKSIGVVLSGSANDGTLGLHEIKTAGGITFAQDASAEQPSMPRSAIASGYVDLVLAPHEIARELARISRHPFASGAPQTTVVGVAEPLFPRILETLRNETGVDFTHYKRNTLHRRITRRMVLNRLDGLADYARMLEHNPKEVENLYQDILINVTSFFRNPESYDVIRETVFPRIAAAKPRNDHVRVWVLGCSTGEEAYSIAMAWQEFAEASARRMPIQVFATDLNAVSIERARAGIYPKGISQDVSPERLRRFFHEADGHYRISKVTRDMCVFARQNVLADPPFSRMDLIACRNLLIYLEPVLQQRLMPLMHYSLRPGGFLWLGGSETIGIHRELFETKDSKNRIYAKRGGPEVSESLPIERVGQLAHRAERQTAVESMAEAIDPQREADRMLLSRYAPPGVLLDEDLNIVQFRGDTGAFLAPAPGRASLNLLKMLREGLLVGVRGAVQRARREKLPVREEGLHVRTHSGYRSVNVLVMPMRAGGAGSMLVVFEDAGERSPTGRLKPTRSPKGKAAAPPDAVSREKEIERLTQELAATREYLQAVIEQQESSNEELQSANEEVQSSNEELQSTNEELETSKEEIQASNEELETVNEELQGRNAELAEANDDLVNLLASVRLPIIMLGPDLRIRRFTPAAQKLLNLVPGDVGRPIDAIRLNLDLADLDKILADVVHGPGSFERAVQDRAGHWYSLRVRQYRTAENRIDGVVIVLVDIDALTRAGEVLRESEERFAKLADTAPVLFWTTSPKGLDFVNRAYEEYFGISSADLDAYDWTEAIHPEDRPAYLTRYEKAACTGSAFIATARVRRKDGAYRWIKSIGAPRIAKDGHFAGFVGTSLDVTDLKEEEPAKRRPTRRAG